MLRQRNFDRACCIVLAATLLVTCCYMGAAAAGLIGKADGIGYENRLFDTSRVHTLDIVMDDWDGFIEQCTDEEYAACTVVIDGEKYGNVAIRAKGNTSLSSVAAYGNDRYSFKIEFDHYQTGKTYYGLDKLCLNNIIQDKTYLKDYLAYTLMNKMGVPAPLCSFVQINVNGEAWGLYLAVEGVEDGFLTRNYGVSTGNLYKPDSMSFGGGRGNGRDFDMDDFREQLDAQENASDSADASDSAPQSGGFTPGEDFSFGDMPAMPDGGDFSADGDFTPGEDFSFGDMPAMPDGGDFSADGDFTPPDMPGGGGGGGGFGGMGSDDVKLKYIDDDPDSYSNIFDSAKTDIDDEDKSRLIASLKALSEGGEEAAAVVDTDEVIRYLVVHNFLCNGDSYTGSMVHNYYLYEEDGVLSMIPWDYNLAFGGFDMGGFGGSGATSTVNSPIDSPVSGTLSDRPMIAWIFDSEEYTARYHELYAEFIETVFDSGWFEEELDRVTALIDSYVKADTNGFFTYDQFQTGVAALREFCLLRAESISGQLDGTIPSTSAGQTADSSALVDASSVSLSDMGEFSGGGGGGKRGGDMNRGEGDMSRSKGGMSGGRFGGARDENAQTENTQTENTQTENTQTENTQTENTQTENTQTENTQTEGMQKPDAAPQNTDAQDQSAQGAPENARQSFSPPDAGFGKTASRGTNTAAIVWFAVSVLLLAAAIVFAVRFKNYR